MRPGDRWTLLRVCSSSEGVRRLKLSMIATQRGKGKISIRVDENAKSSIGVLTDIELPDERMRAAVAKHSG